MKAVICPVCNGTGRIHDPTSTDMLGKECHGCGERGWVEVQDTPYYPCIPNVPSYPQPWYPPYYPPYYTVTCKCATASNIAGRSNGTTQGPYP